MKGRILRRVLLHIFLPLLVGLLLYLLYRPDVWIASQFGIKPIPHSATSGYSLLEKWIIFSGPDLCWAYSFASAIFILNHFFRFSSHGLVFNAVLVFVGASELIQLFSKPTFTFSFSDLVTVIAGCCLSAYLNKRI